MRTFKIIFMDGYDEVQNLDTNEPIFSTKGIDPEVIDNVVYIWNETGSANVNLYSGGKVDDYLLNEEKCSQEDREHITEALYLHSQR